MKQYIEINAETFAKLQARARESGYDSVEELLEAYARANG